MKKIHKEARVPRWLTCTWRREPCGKRQCPVCGVLQAECRALQARGAADDEVLDAMDDLRYEIAEAFLDIVYSPGGATKKVRERVPHHLKTRYQSRGSVLYRELDQWHERLHGVCDEAFSNASFWVESTQAADVDWYAHILLDYLRRFQEYRSSSSPGSVAEHYSLSVLTEAAEVIKERLSGLGLQDSSEKGDLMLLYAQFVPHYKQLREL